MASLCRVDPVGCKDSEGRLPPAWARSRRPIWEVLPLFLPCPHLGRLIPLTRENGSATTSEHTARFHWGSASLTAVLTSETLQKWEWDGILRPTASLCVNASYPRYLPDICLICSVDFSCHCKSAFRNGCIEAQGQILYNETFQATVLSHFGSLISTPVSHCLCLGLICSYYCR